MCLTCVYLLKPVRLHCMRDTMEPQLILPLCMNHADSPGEVREVHPCECCRNFQARHEPSQRTEPPQPPSPEIKYIPLNRGQFAIVDAGDYEWLNQYKWCLKGGRGGLYYACRAERGKMILMHREIMQPPPGMVVDHINHNPVNNRRCNLRTCTLRENHRNRRFVRNKSGFIGVYPHGKKWKAMIHSGGKVVYQEVFDDKVEAAKARDRKAFELFGPFAYLNFPDEFLPGQACPYEGKCDSCPLAQGSTSALGEPLVEPEAHSQQPEPTTSPAKPSPRYIDLSGTIVGHSFAFATLTVVHGSHDLSGDG
jgi:hypothetical protein